MTWDFPLSKTENNQFPGDILAVTSWEAGGLCLCLVFKAPGSDMNKGKMTTEDVRNPRGQLLGLAMDVPKKPERRCVWVCVWMCVCVCVWWGGGVCLRYLNPLKQQLWNISEDLVSGPGASQPFQKDLKTAGLFLGKRQPLFSWASFVGSWLCLRGIWLTPPPSRELLGGRGLLVTEETQLSAEVAWAVLWVGAYLQEIWRNAQGCHNYLRPGKLDVKDTWEQESLT